MAVNVIKNRPQNCGAALFVSLAFRGVGDARYLWLKGFLHRFI